MESPNFLRKPCQGSKESFRPLGKTESEDVLLEGSTQRQIKTRRQMGLQLTVREVMKKLEGSRIVSARDTVACKF